MFRIPGNVPAFIREDKKFVKYKLKSSQIEYIVVYHVPL